MDITAIPQAGQTAPDFRLRGPGGHPVTLSEYRNKQHVVLVFFPLAFSPVCSHQLPDVQAAVPAIEARGGAVLGISVDSHYANEAFARSLELTFPLLSDWAHEVSKAYGIYLEDRRFSHRATFIVDRGGAIAHLDLAQTVSEIPDIQRIVARLETLG